MVDLRNPLRHSIVVGIFRLEEKFKQTPVDTRKQTSRGPVEAAVSPNPPESRIPFGDQPQANVAVREGRLRRTEGRSDEVIVEVRSPHGELGLFKSEQAVVVPWRLPKRGEGNPVPAEQPRVRVRSRMDMGEELRLEEPLLGPHRLKGSDAAEHFASVAPGHPYGGDLARLLIDVQVWRTADVDASVGEIHTALGIVGK